MVLLPSLKSLDSQPFLFPQPIISHAYVRNHLGELVEILLAKLLGGRRFSTDSRTSYCPDIAVPLHRSPVPIPTYQHRHALTAFIECKAAGRSNQTFIYSGRLEKDKAFSEENLLLYGIWHHATPTKEAATTQELEALFLYHTRSIYLLPFSSVYALAQTLPIEKLNSKYYHPKKNEATYGQGYRLPIKQLVNYPHVRLSWKTERQLF